MKLLHFPSLPIMVIRVRKPLPAIARWADSHDFPRLADLADSTIKEPDPATWFGLKWTTLVDMLTDPLIGWTMRHHFHQIERTIIRIVEAITPADY